MTILIPYGTELNQTGGNLAFEIGEKIFYKRELKLNRIVRREIGGGFDFVRETFVKVLGKFRCDGNFAKGRLPTAGGHDVVIGAGSKVHAEHQQRIRGISLGKHLYGPASDAAGKIPSGMGNNAPHERRRYVTGDGGVV